MNHSSPLTKNKSLICNPLAVKTLRPKLRGNKRPHLLQADQIWKITDKRFAMLEIDAWLCIEIRLNADG